MKKILTLIAVSVASIALAVADPIIVGHGYFGVGLGSTVTDSNGDKISNAKWNFASNLDFGGGIGVNIPFGGYFGIQPGVDFYVNNVGYTQSSSWSVGALSYSSTTNVKLNYLSLDIPVLFTVKLDKFNFALGPYVSIPLGDIKSTVDATTTVSGTTTPSNDSHNLQHSWGSVGITVGAGYEQRLGMGRLVCGLRYMIDIIPIEIKEGDTVRSKFNRGALAVDLGYKLPLSFFGL